MARNGAWCYYAGGVGVPVLLGSSSYPAGDLAVGDFDGDGVSDVFRADGVEWRWSRGGTMFANGGAILKFQTLSKMWILAFWDWDSELNEIETKLGAPIGHICQQGRHRTLGRAQDIVDCVAQPPLCRPQRRRAHRRNGDVEQRRRARRAVDGLLERQLELESAPIFGDASLRGWRGGL